MLLLSIGNAILEGDNKKLEQLINEFWKSTLKNMQPLNFSGLNPENEEIKQDKIFSLICNQLQDYTPLNPKKMTTYDFYSLMAYVKKKLKKTTPK